MQSIRPRFVILVTVLLTATSLTPVFCEYGLDATLIDMDRSEHPRVSADRARQRYLDSQLPSDGLGPLPITSVRPRDLIPGAYLLLLARPAHRSTAERFAESLLGQWQDVRVIPLWTAGIPPLRLISIDTVEIGFGPGLSPTALVLELPYREPDQLPSAAVAEGHRTTIPLAHWMRGPETLVLRAVVEDFIIVSATSY